MLKVLGEHSGLVSSLSGATVIQGIREVMAMTHDHHDFVDLLSSFKKFIKMFQFNRDGSNDEQDVEVSRALIKFNAIRMRSTQDFEENPARIVGFIKDNLKSLASEADRLYAVMKEHKERTSLVRSYGNGKYTGNDNTDDAIDYASNQNKVVQSSVAALKREIAELKKSRGTRTSDTASGSPDKKKRSPAISSLMTLIKKQCPDIQNDALRKKAVSMCAGNCAVCLKRFDHKKPCCTSSDVHSYMRRKVSGLASNLTE